jgi:hypothetical protein
VKLEYQDKPFLEATGQFGAHSELEDPFAKSKGSSE